MVSSESHTKMAIQAVQTHSNLLLLTVNIDRKGLVVKEMLDVHTSLSPQTHPFRCMDFAAVENSLLIASTNSIQSVVFCARLVTASEVSAMSW